MKKTNQPEPAALDTTPAALPAPVNADAIAEKVNQVFKWILAGQGEYDIREAVRSNYGHDEDARALVLAAMERLANANDFSESVIRGWCIEATRDLYRRMVEVGDFTGALRAVKQLRDLT